MTVFNLSKRNDESTINHEVTMITNWVLDLCNKSVKSGSYYNFYGFTVKNGFVRSIWSINYKTDYYSNTKCSFMFKTYDGHKYSVEYTGRFIYIRELH